MAYDLHIEHAENTPDGEFEPIPLEDWRAAVAATEGVRLFAGEFHTLTIPGPRKSLPLRIMRLLLSWRARGSPAAHLPSTAGDRPPPAAGTQRVIRIRATEGDVEAWFPGDGQWYWAFTWREGSASLPARFEPGDASHPVWAAAVKLASRLGAVIRGDEGETYDLQTGRAIRATAAARHTLEKDTAALDDVAAMTQQELELVFAPKGIQATDVVEVAQRLFVRHGIPEHGFEFDGVASELEISKRLKRRQRVPTEIKGHGFTIDPGGELASVRLWRASIKAETPIRIPWDDWVIDLFNESFISAWVADVDYEFWQNAKDLLHYKARGRPWEHLPMRSNGLPPPLEQTIVDTSNNPGRRLLHVGFIEAVGAVMWFGERFWQVSSASKQRVLSEPWLQCAEIAPGLLRVQAAVQCFSTDQGEAGDLQRKLRALLFHA
jgi:hypothetical protein